MKEIFLVHPTEAQMARHLEKVLLSLPEISGILFAGAIVLPGDNMEKKDYHITIGCTHSVDPKLINVVVQAYLKKELPEGIRLYVDIRQGIGRENYA